MVVGKNIKLYGTIYIPQLSIFVTLTCWHREICCSYLVGLTMETARKEHPKVRKLQGDQLKMAVFFWYLGKSCFYSERVCSSVHWTSHFLQGTRNTRPGNSN